jgi:integrative and conjugative element protein (TIGR02256 family)
VAEVEPVAPRSPRAKALIDYLTNAADYPYGRVVAVLHEDGFDVVDVMVEPQLDQKRVVPILNEESVRFRFPVEGDEAPKIYARRADFPADLTHTNFDRTDNGYCLCVWEENWDDLRRALTAQALFERVRDWLAKTAAGTLHAEGQALEPMIPVTASTVILPPGEPPALLHIHEYGKDGSALTLRLDASPSPTSAYHDFSIMRLELPPQVHGALHGLPLTLAGLRDLLAPLGADLAQALGDWLVAPEQRAGEDRNILILLVLPKRARAKAKVTDWDIWALQPMEKLFALSERLGRTAPDPATGRPQVLLTPDRCGDLGGVDLYTWRVVQRLDRSTARRYAGTKLKKDSPLVAIGAGAIGSNVMTNAVRAGIGPWTVIDDDINLPHNIVRQVHFDPMVGHSKALSATALLNAILAEEGNRGITADFLDAEEPEATAIGAALESAAVAIDFSASPAVLGALADDGRAKRAASFFFNPEGSDLVILGEAKDRVIRLDEIEAQYFLATATSRWLEGHLDGSRVDFVRYANACQDLMRPVPPWQFQTLCGIAAGQIASVITDRRAKAAIWRLDPATGTIVPIKLRLSKVHRYALQGFRVTVADHVISTMRALRREAAPNETGGILIGSYDLARRVIHVVEALPAPPDSRQTPTYFVRGAKDLKPLVEELARRSAGAISYLGEWHSHPDRCDARPSDDDEEVFAYLRKHLDPTGSPYLMAICGDVETWLRAGWYRLDPGEAVIAYE